MADKQKINWLLILQGWAMLWVVIGHSGPAHSLDDYPQYAANIWNFAYSFHMYLFMAISGFLFYLTRLNSEKWTWIETMKEKLIRFGIPFLVFTLIGMVIKYLFAGSVSRATTISIGEFFHAIIYPYNGPMREFWFLATILWYFTLFHVWKYVLKNRWAMLILFVILAVLTVKHPETEFLAIRSTTHYAFYFYLGILCAVGFKQKPSVIEDKRFIILSLICGTILYFIGNQFHVPTFTPIGISLASLSLALLLDRFCPKAFSSFRNYTYQIYIMGLFPQVVLSMIRQKMGLPFTPIYILNMIVGLYVPVLISKLLEWINWKPLLLCVGLKKINYNKQNE